MKTILCGYLPGTESVRYHPVQNIRLTESDDWSRAEICYTDKETKLTKTLYTIGNIPNTSYNIVMLDTHNYMIALYVNGKLVIELQHLFHVEIKIHLCSEIADLTFIQYHTDHINDN
jgi:hypothetical protein